MSRAEFEPSRRASREVRIRVLNADHKPAEGAEVFFSIDDEPCGSVTIGRNGQASLRTQNQDAIIDVLARYGKNEQRASLQRGMDKHDFDFDFVIHIREHVPPVARCPDGTTGQPCVECDIDGETIRICS